MTISHRDSLRAMQPWVRFSERYWWEDPVRPELGCYGSGYNNWGVQTNQKYVGAMAVLAADPELDEAACGISREEILDRSLRALRYCTASHLSGDHHCSDGTRWGHTWISALGIERMMHGLEAIEPHLGEAEHEGIRRMIVSEADALLELPVTATKWNAEGGNRPEANMWNGALLWRASYMYPDDPGVPRWQEKGTRFLLNAISVPRDASDDRVIHGLPLREWHIGPNFFDSFALDHHGYLNVAYMLTCLSNMAMMHFACVTREWEPPPGLYHHGEELWSLVRRVLFADGRICRIGGDSRQRYTRAQDYLLPVLLLAAARFGDHGAAGLEAAALERIRFEQDWSGDGSYFSRRLREIREINPYYYTRIESDRIMGLGMNAYWRRVVPVPSEVRDDERESSVGGGWSDAEHGAMVHRSPRRIASWSWRARQRPMGLCLPPDASDLAEWDWNLAGSVLPLGGTGGRELLECAQESFEGGFITWGAMDDRAGASLAEGWTMSEPLVHRYAVAALPDARTMVVLQRCVSPIRCWFREVKGLKLNVPNDIFNRGKRRYEGEGGVTELEGRSRGIVDLGSRWVCIDRKLGAVGIYGGESIAVVQAGERRASDYGESLRYDEVCIPCRAEVFVAEAGEVLLDCGSAVLSGADASETAEVCASARRIVCPGEAIRAVALTGGDGERYVLAANFGSSEALMALGVEEAADLATGERLAASGECIEFGIGAGQARLLRVQVSQDGFV